MNGSRLLPALAAACLVALLPIARVQGEEVPRPDPELVKLVERLQKHYANTQDYRARFVQVTQMQAMGTREESAGTVQFRRPDKMRFDYDPPDARSLIGDGKTVWFYHPADKQVYRQPFSKAMSSRTPIALLAGSAKLTDEFLVALKDRDAEKNTVRLFLLPRTPDPGAAEVYLTIEETTLTILATEITDTYGNRTTVRFSDARINTGIADSVFVFTPPPGVEVIAAP